MNKVRHGRVSCFTTESTENTEVGKGKGVRTGRNPTLLFPIRLCGLCDLCGEKLALPYLCGTDAGAGGGMGAGGGAPPSGLAAAGGGTSARNPKRVFFSSTGVSLMATRLSEKV